MSYNGRRAALALTFDHEMCTNFPYRNSVWDHRKGEIDAETREYLHKQSAQAASFGAPVTYFLVASMLATGDPGYLRQVVAAGHEIGNHTYSHVDVTATGPKELRGAYASQPGLIGRRTPREVIADEIASAQELIRDTLAVAPQGFRTPYGFTHGLADQPWFRQLLKQHGFRYASSRYFGWDLWDERLAEAGLDTARLLHDLRRAQPYRYADGLIEFPIVTPSDCHAFRPWRWPIGRWVAVVKRLIDLAYEHGLVVDLCCHPAILAACDPDHQTVAVAVEHARSKPDGVWITTLSELAGSL